MKKMNNNKKIQNKNEKAITLVALVVTIIVLIILAGVTISLVLKENGILDKTVSANTQMTIEAIREKLELLKGYSYINQEGVNNLDEYLKVVEEKGIAPYVVTNIMRISDNEAIIEVDNKYSYIVTGDSNIEIKYEGKLEDIERPDPAVEVTITGEETQTSIPVKLSVNVADINNNISTMKWVLNTSSEELGTDESLYTQTTEENFELSISEGNTYYLHIYTANAYEVEKETIKGPINIGITYHQHIGSSSSGGGCYVRKSESYIPSSPWNNCDDTSNLGWTGSENGENVYRYRCNCCGSEFRGTNGWHHCSGSKHRQTRYWYEIGCGKTPATIESISINY